jgi:hypothetical protein
MINRCILGILALVAAFASDAAVAFDDAKYPDWKGLWRRGVPAQWDPTKPGGLRQQAPLTPEYQAIFEANLKEQNSGGQSYNSQAYCLPGGTPRVMIAYGPLEFIITPDLTYMHSDHLAENRRIFTDGRGFPEKFEPTWWGHSIGKWIDDDGDGRYDALDVETRGLRGKRTLDAGGIPLHADNATVVQERIFLDKGNPDLLHDRVTIIDHAFMRPWTVTRSFRRERNAPWIEETCAEANRYLILGKETYYLSGERLPMPTRKDQPPPDLRKFETR